MLTFDHRVNAADVRIYFPERPDDLAGFREFIGGPDSVLCIDTETTGLDIHARDHRLRLVQFGNRDEAWVMDAERFRGEICEALRRPRHYTMHNAPYDMLVLDRHLGVRIEELAGRTFDTRVFAHLIDPRQESEGGAGLGLKPLSTIYVDASAEDTANGLTAVFRSIGETKATGWAAIPTTHPVYLTYAGLDVIYGRRLFDELRQVITGLGLDDLAAFELHLQALLAIMQRRGVLLDVAYTRGLVDSLHAEAERFSKVAARYGVANINSTAQVAEALAAMGETLTERTPSGNPKVDKAVLLPLADLDRDWHRIGARDPNPLADAVLRSKRAAKWSGSYAEAALDLRDADDRVHPMIGALAARTGRMSVSRPPLQQLPSSDWTIRRAFVADPGHVICGVDYQAVEMRVLAALADEPTMKKALADGEDLHSFTAERVFGPDFTSRERKIAKTIGFGKVYGGGAETASRQTGAPVETIRQAMAAYDATFPGIKAFSRRLQARAEYGKREVVTPAGRHLPLDRDRLYSATNYMVQSTARDLLAEALVDLFDQGLGDLLLLPVHDEVIMQAPEGDAADAVIEVQRVMERRFYGVDILADPEVYGFSWGHGYNIPADDPAYVRR